MNFLGALPLPTSNIAKLKEKMTNQESRTYDSKRLVQKPCITCTINVKISGKFTSTVFELFQRWKTTIGLISKKSNFARAAHFFFTFLCRCFARLQRETSTNFLVTRFMEELSYVFSFIFFFAAAHFHLALVAASISHVVTAATKFSCCSSKKKCLLFRLRFRFCWLFSCLCFTRRGWLCDFPPK